MELRYRDNEGDVRIWVAGGSDSEVDALAKRFEDAAQDEALADKLIAMDAILAATPMEDAMGLADKLHEVTRDASIEIDSWKRRFRGAVLLAAVGWCILTWLAIVAIWMAL